MSGELVREPYDAFCDMMEEVGPDRAARLVAALITVHVMSHPDGPEHALEQLRLLAREAMVHAVANLDG